MSFISYAQNLEDVILYRCLHDLGRGFYIDIGAQDPTIDSVTRAFYERGWRGINVEPNAEYFEYLQRDRPEDINLMMLVGREAGENAFYEVVETGLSTTNPEYARRHAGRGYQVRTYRMPCTTLDSICHQNKIETVHFLKIDVEGDEGAVLEGFSFKEARPWVVVAEATEPNTSRDVSREWEPLIVSRGYEPVYFDGLNRFYLAAEHRELKERFSRPPNFFDHYLTYRECRARQRAAVVEKVAEQDRAVLISCLNHLMEETHSLRRSMAQLEEGISNAQRHLDEVRQQHSVEQRRLADELEQARMEAATRERAMAEERAAERRELSVQVQRLNGRLLESETELRRLGNRLRALRESISWKVTSPMREVRRGAVRVVRLVRRQPRREANGVARLPPEEHPTILSRSLADDSVVAGLSEPARAIYHALKETIARKQ